MKKLYILLCFGLFVIACNNSNIDDIKTTNASRTLTTSLLKSSPNAILKSDAEFNIDKMILESNTWVFTISHSGGCDSNYHFIFYHKPKTTTDCVVDTIHVALKTQNTCKRLDNTTVKVNLGNYSLCSKKLVFLGGTKIIEIIR